MTIPQPTEKAGLERAIDDLLNQMNSVTADTPEYSAMTDQLVKLLQLRSDIGPKRISPDVKATILANLAGILVIVGHERAHIVTSKALGFIMKLR